MTTINFDTLEYVEELIRVGIEPLHAEAITRATSKAMNQTINSTEIASRKDLYEMKLELIQMINYSSWKTISLLAGVQSVLFGIFGFIQYIAH